MKRCNTCKILLDVSNFHINRARVDGLQPKCKECTKEYRNNNRERYNELARNHASNYYNENKKKVNARHKEYQKTDKGRKVNRKKAANYRSLVKRQTIKLTDDQKKWLDWHYKMAVIYEKLTGIPHEVDHIHPLSKNGLHVPWNLQVIPAIENRQKSAKLL